MHSIKNIDLKGKRVLVRSDLNVPIADGKVADDTRIKASMATYQHILNAGGSLAIMSHLGRPKLPVKDPREFSLAPLLPVLSEMLGAEVVLLSEFRRAPDDGKVYLYENTRLMEGEKNCEPQLSESMASCADVVVMDAFASCHRQDASTYGVLEYAKEFTMGLLLEREVKVLSDLMEAPERPMVAVVGGAKISGKIDVLLSLLDEVDFMVVVGAMANTFLAASGYNVGRSLYEEDKLKLAKEILNAKTPVYMPEDVIVMQEDETIACKDIGDIADSDVIYDVGYKTINYFAQILSTTKTLIWNGPFGKYEDRRFATGGIEFAKTVALSEVTCIAGGGDTISVIKAAGVYDDISYISTGGGAFLSLLEGKKLPCLGKLYGKLNATTD